MDPVKAIAYILDEMEQRSIELRATADRAVDIPMSRYHDTRITILDEVRRRLKRVGVLN